MLLQDTTQAPQALPELLDPQALPAPQALQADQVIHPFYTTDFYQNRE